MASAAISAVGVFPPVSRLASDAHSRFSSSSSSMRGAQFPGAASRIEAPQVCCSSRAGGARAQASAKVMSGVEPTLYDVLGIGASADAKEIKAAFRQLARRYHPDVVAEEKKEECTKDFLKIHSAYTTLSQPESKSTYDLQLLMQRFGTGPAWSPAPINSDWDFSSPSSDYCAPRSTASDYFYCAPRASASDFNSYSAPRSAATDYPYSAPRDFSYSAPRSGASDYSYCAPRSAATDYSAPSSFNSQWKGRSWETDQCW